VLALAPAVPAAPGSEMPTAAERGEVAALLIRSGPAREGEELVVREPQPELEVA